MKKIGSDTPARATPIDTRSTALPRLSAEITPVVTPNSSQITAAPPARDSVTGSRSSRSGQTGVWLMKE